MVRAVALVAPDRMTRPVTRDVRLGRLRDPRALPGLCLGLVSGRLGD
jgi:hypothetical protein